MNQPQVQQIKFIENLRIRGIYDRDIYFRVTLFRTLGGIEDIGGNNIALIEFNHQKVFSAMVAKQAVAVIAVSPGLHAVIYACSPGFSECRINFILGGFPDVDS